MDWLSILNQCLDIILPAVASVIAVLFGVLGTKIKRLYDSKVTDETVQTVIKSVVQWAQQVYKDTKGEEKLNAALEKASTILNEKGITISETELHTLIESAVYGLKQGTSQQTIDVIPEISETITNTTSETTEENK